MMSENQATHSVSLDFARNANIDSTVYKERYAHSIEHNEDYWREQAALIDWITPPTKIKDVSYDLADHHIRWYEDGELNISTNCLDKQVAKHPLKPAIIWEGDHPSEHKIISFQELHQEVCRFANVLKKKNVKKGDRVTIYMPMIPEAAIAMLACTRIGAVHSVVFGGFSPDSLATRILDSDSRIVITADEGLRGGKTIPLKRNVDTALGIVSNTENASDVVDVIVVHRTGNPVDMVDGRDVWYHAEIAEVNDICPPEPMNAEDPLFLLYTSGSTGKPKGVLHTTGGYLVYAVSTFQNVFDINPDIRSNPDEPSSEFKDDVYWCTADVGWITGHSYVVYAPLASGVTTLMFEGVPNFPTWARIGHIVDKHDVSILYTAPTAIRAMMREGDDYVRESDRSSLRLLGTVGEPINPEAWDWYYKVVGESRCPIVDTWWQTETGGMLIAPIPNTCDMKPGAAMQPLFGIKPELVDAEGNIIPYVTGEETEGNLVIADSWPGQMRTVYGNQQRFLDTYFSAYKGKYFTGDGAKRDADGHFWITGRVDDVLNVSGHRLGTAEIESALVAHPSVAESAVVGMPHEVKGQGICAYVMLQAGVDTSEGAHDALKDELNNAVRHDVGAIATLDRVIFTDGLPKTRSGKIMRRLLRKLAAGEIDSLGDTSTLADTSVLDALILQVTG